jgi:hypothetical protein
VIRRFVAIALAFLFIQTGIGQQLRYATDSLSFIELRTVALEEGDTSTASCARFHRFIWFEESSETAQKLNHKLYADLSEIRVRSVSELKDIFTSDFNDWSAEWQSQFTAEDSSPLDFSFNLTWSEENVIGVLYQTASTICIYESLDGYYGGAHPNGATRYRVFSLPEATQVEKWTELFEDKDTQAILKLAEERFRSEKGLSSKVSLNEAGYWFNNNRFHLTDNFGFDADGLFFLFNPYEIASYAEGPIFISIPYNKLRKYLKKPL